MLSCFQKSLFSFSQNDIEAHEPTYDNLLNEGPKWVQDESDLQQQSLKEQLDSIEAGWKELHELSDNRQKQLLQSLNYQVGTMKLLIRL